MQNGRRLAFDFGDVRIGYATSDTNGLIATPVGAIQNRPESLGKELSNLFQEFDPIYIAIGMPKHLSGKPSVKEESVLKFAQFLRTLTQLPIYAIDERLTTVSAARTLRDRGQSAKSSKSDIDAYAAAEILDSALNQERLSGAPRKRLL
jgi:putative holliday junction resolvase